MTPSVHELGARMEAYFLVIYHWGWKPARGMTCEVIGSAILGRN